MEKADRYVEDIVVQHQRLEAVRKKFLINVGNLVVGEVKVDDVQKAQVHLQLINLIVG